LDKFLSFGTCALSQAHFTSQQGSLWTRTVSSIHPDSAHPIVVITDSFAGPEAAASKIFSMNLMAKDEVHTPAGPLLPPVRSDRQKNTLPSAGKVFTLEPGVNRLHFTGQWLIDWD